MTISRPEGGTIAVQLTNSTYQSYLAGATVTANNGTSTFSATTNSSGYAEIRVTEAGTYTVSATPTYFNTASSSCEIAYKQEVRLALSAKETDLGTVKYSSGYLPIKLRNVSSSWTEGTGSGYDEVVPNRKTAYFYTKTGTLPSFEAEVYWNQYTGSSSTYNNYVCTIDRSKLTSAINSMNIPTISTPPKSLISGYRLKFTYTATYYWGYDTSMSQDYIILEGEQIFNSDSVESKSVRLKDYSSKVHSPANINYVEPMLVSYSGSITVL